MYYTHDGYMICFHIKDDLTIIISYRYKKGYSLSLELTFINFLMIASTSIMEKGKSLIE